MSVNNDFHQPRTIFEVLDGLTEKNLDKISETQTKPTTNGNHVVENGL
jgi:methylenetetrahydrofolate reductase (NADPH)